MQTNVINVEGINNTNRATILKDAITSLVGVSNVSVDVSSSKLTVTFDPSSTGLSEIKDKITNTGFGLH